MQNSESWKKPFSLTIVEPVWDIVQLCFLLTLNNSATLSLMRQLSNMRIKSNLTFNSEKQ